MSIKTMVATNEDAENLWKYILAYRKHMGNISIDSNQSHPPEVAHTNERLKWSRWKISIDSKNEHPLEENVTVGVIPLEETGVARAKNSKD